MKYLACFLVIILFSNYCIAKSSKDSLPDYKHTIQLGVVNHHRQSIGVNLSYGQKINSYKIHRYGINIVQYHNDLHSYQANVDGIHEMRQNIKEVDYTASFGQQFYKNVFRNLDINCGYDIAAGYSKMKETRTIYDTLFHNDIAYRNRLQFLYNGLSLRITPYAGATIKIAKRLTFSGEFSMQSPRITFHWSQYNSHSFNSDLDLFFLNSSFRIGYQF